MNKEIEIIIHAIDTMIALVGILKKDTALPVERISVSLNAEIALLELRLLMVQHGGVYDGNLPSVDTSKFLVVLDSSGNHTAISMPQSEEELKKLMYVLRWGTYGYDGKSPLTWVRLVDCSSDHLQNILKTQAHISPFYEFVIRFILKMRNV